ncbi:NEDD8 ultimate buster 1-like [Lytechinus pictus]|uniref:NEDD8 ultimate buster 1-like n=1 Tax=Lytechinus pictus TaxID=7653 RepID=UPI0030BA2742
MVAMGFSKSTVAAALRHTNNDLHGALRIIQEQPELLSLPDTDVVPGWDGPITDEMIAQLTELGFNVDVAKDALKRYGGVVNKAVEKLLSSGGILLPLPSPSSTAGASNSADEVEKLTAEQKQAIEDVLPDIPDHEEDYLDITLEEEASFIAEYKARIHSAL